MNDFETSVQQMIDGELAHDDRIRLVEGLEAKPELWRQVGLAFLENQLLCETLKSTDGENASNSCSRTEHVGRPIVHPNRASRIPVIAWLTAMAACLLLGVFVGSSSTTKGQSIAAQTPAEDDLTEHPVVNAEFADAIARSATPIPNHFRRELLKAGFLVNEVETLKTVMSPIGGSVDIPIREVEIKYLGNSIYQ